MEKSIISKALECDIALLCKSHADFSNDSYSTVSVSYPNFAIRFAVMINEISQLLFVYFKLNQRLLKP
jgi:hypothetical protein